MTKPSPKPWRQSRAWVVACVAFTVACDTAVPLLENVWAGSTAPDAATSGPPPRWVSVPTPGPTRAAAPADAGNKLEGLGPTPPGTVFKWTDRHGGIHLSTDAPPPDARGVTVALADAPRPGDRQTPAPAQAPAATAPPPTAAPPSNAAGPKPALVALPQVQVRSAAGSYLNLAAMASSQPTLVVFSAAYCGPCRHEAQQLAQMQRAQPTRYRLLTMLLTDEGQQATADWANTYGLQPSTVFALPAKHFPRGGIPFNNIVDRQGRVVAQTRGSPGAQALAAMLDRVP